MYICSCGWNRILKEQYSVYQRATRQDGHLSKTNACFFVPVALQLFQQTPQKSENHFTRTFDEVYVSALTLS